MKILILGATGQIGRVLVETLAGAGHEVTVLVRQGGGQKFTPGVRVLEQDAFTVEAFVTALSGMDHVVYGIGLPEQFLFDTRVFESVNCDLLRAFLAAFATSGLRTLTYLSTYEVFAVRGLDIDETQPIADPAPMTPYFQSMIHAYRMVTEFAQRSGIALTTIHPAAVYGGRNTGSGITDYMENLASRNWISLPFIMPTSFPVVHVDALADAVIRSLGRPGPYIVSDGMTSLQDIAQAMRAQTRSYVPLTLPLWVTTAGVRVLEAVARVTGVKPFASAVQVAFLTKGWRPSASKAQAELGWTPLPLATGIAKFLEDRRRRLDRMQPEPDSVSARALKRTALCQRITAIGLALYWAAYFTVGLAPEPTPAGYFAFQNSFPYADLILAGLMAVSASLLGRREPHLRRTGFGCSLVGAGALLFLGGLDITFNIQNGVYRHLSLDSVLEMGINAWCIIFGALQVAAFLPRIAREGVEG